MLCTYGFTSVYFCQRNLQNISNNIKEFIYIISFLLNRLNGSRMEPLCQLVTDSAPSMILALSSLISSTVMERILALMSVGPPISLDQTQPVEL